MIVVNKADLVADAADAAALAHAVYSGSGRAGIPPKLAAIMIPNATEYYGLATFNLTHVTGLARPAGTSFGHLEPHAGSHWLVAPALKKHPP